VAPAAAAPSGGWAAGAPGDDPATRGAVATVVTRSTLVFEAGR